MMEVGRLCVKTAGRDAGQTCVILDVLDNNYVLVDGQTRRKKCNVSHLEPLKDTLNVKKNADHADVIKELKKLGIEVKAKVKKEKKHEETGKDKKPIKKTKKASSKK